MIGGILCGIYAFIIFIPLHWVISLLSKLSFSAIVVLLVFGLSSLKSYLKTIVIFYTVSFLMGGITTALLYVSGMSGMTANGAVYLHEFTYLQIAAGVLATWVLGCWLTAFVKERLQKQKVFTDMTIEIGDQKWNARAMVDTGNFLRDPISGNPAAVLSAACASKILMGLDKVTLDCRHCIIPFKTIGRSGIMEGVRPDRVIIEGRTISKIVLAISEEDFVCWNGEETYEVLLQQQILQGGVLENAR